MILRVQQGLAAEGFEVSLSKLCRWFGVPRPTVYYRPGKSAPKVDPKYVEPIKAMIEESPSFEYRTVAWLLGFNKNTVQRFFQIKGWQVRKRPIGFRPRILGIAFSGHNAERTLVHRSMPYLGRPGRLGHVGAGHRLPYPQVAGLASVAQRQGLHAGQRPGTRLDRSVRDGGESAGAVPASV